MRPQTYITAQIYARFFSYSLADALELKSQSLSSTKVSTPDHTDLDPLEARPPHPFHWLVGPAAEQCWRSEFKREPCSWQLRRG